MTYIPTAGLTLEYPKTFNKIDWLEVYFQHIPRVLLHPLVLRYDSSIESTRLSVDTLMYVGGVMQKDP